VLDLALQALLAANTAATMPGFAIPIGASIQSVSAAAAADAPPASDPPCDRRAVPALAEAARAAYQAGNHALAAELFAVASDRAPEDPVLAYNAACAAALAGRRDQAFALLERAVGGGYRSRSPLANDPDLVSLLEDPRWPTLVADLAHRQAEDTRITGGASLATPFRPDLPPDEKLAGLALVWAEARTNFANFDLVPTLDWDAAYLATIPRVLATTSTLDFYRELRAFYARLGDGHTLVHYPRALWTTTSARPPLVTRKLGDRVAILAVHDEALVARGVTPGLELLAIDGVPVAEWAATRVAPYTAASTPHDRDARVFGPDLLAGPLEERLVLRLADATGAVREETVARLPREEWLRRLERPAFALTTLPGNVAHVELRSFDAPEVATAFAAAFDAIAGHAALILDLRDNGGGNSGHGWPILARLTSEPFATSAWTTRVLRPARRAWGFGEGHFGGVGRQLPAADGRIFRGPVALLTSARTYSAAEDFTVAFDAMERGPIVGEPTGGSTGQPLFFQLPGGGRAQVCAKRDTYPDGRPFVGRGILPDVAVAPTLEDLRAGRDPVLAAALAALGVGRS
jgi:carboxyl-terminal processing protease